MNDELLKQWQSGRSWMLPVMTGVAGLVCGFLFKSTKIDIDKVRNEVRQQIETQYQSQLSTKDTMIAKITQELNYERQLSAQKIEILNVEHSLKVQELTNKINTDNSSKYTEVVKIRRPDGTVEERRVSKTEIEKMSQELIATRKEAEDRVRSEMETKISLKENETQKRVSTVEQEKTILQTEVSNLKQQLQQIQSKEHITISNPKKLEIHAGIATDKLYEAGIGYEIYSPFVVGLGIATDAKKYRGRFVLGVRL